MTTELQLARPSSTADRLLEAAGPLFAEKGLKATSVREICVAADANIAAVNFHFRSKEGLYIAAVRHAYQACARAAPLPSWPKGTPAEQRLRDFVRALLARVVESAGPAWHSLLVWREVAQPTQACAGFVSDFVKPTHDLLMSILRDLTPANLSPEKRTLLGAGIVGHCMHFHHARHILPHLLGPNAVEHLSHDALAEHISNFSLAALAGLFPRKKGGRS